MVSILRRFLLIFCLLLASCWTYASGVAVPPSSKPSNPSIITFGVYPVKIYDLQPKANSFKIDFYAWWRSANPDYKPNDSIEIVNAEDYTSKFGASLKRGNDYITYVHYYATIHHTWSMRYFPFDRQILEVRLEDFGDVHVVQFTPDYLQSRLHSELSVGGWKIAGFHIKQSTTQYLTNFGDTAVRQGEFSRITFYIELKREGWRPYVNYFIGFFMAAFLASLSLFVIEESLSISSGLFLSSIFSFIGNKYLIDQELPSISGFTFFDDIQMLTLVVIVVAMLYSFYYRTRSASADNKKRTRFIGIIMLAAYAVCVAIFTYLANTVS